MATKVITWPVTKVSSWIQRLSLAKGAHQESRPALKRGAMTSCLTMMPYPLKVMPTIMAVHAAAVVPRFQ